jgi:hypothetical protein
LLNGEEKIRWNFHRHAVKREFAAAELFMSPSQASFWIPKRVMSAAQIEELRERLKTRMADGKAEF